MPYSSIEGAKKASFPTQADDIPLTLAQINNLADIYDSVKAAGTAENPMAVAWTTWKKTHKKEDGKWVKVEKHELETEDLPNREIFSIVGDPKGHHYTEGDLEKIVEGFYETKSALKPYLKLGHDEEQKLAKNSGLVQKSGMPALGWIENLRKAGKKLIADFIKVPKKLCELIKVGAYRRLSPEIFWNLAIGGKRYNRLLKDVAILGADTPECGDLNDIMALYIANAEFTTYQTDAKVESYEFDFDGEKILEEKEEKMAELEKLKEENKKYEKEKKEAEEKAKLAEEEKVKAEEATKKAEEEKKKAEEEKGKAEKELTEKKEEETKTEINAKVEKLINDGHWYPADKDILVAKMTDERKASEIKKYKVGEEEKTFEEFFFEIVEKFDVDLNREEKSEIGDMASKEDNRALKAKAEKYAKDNKVSYVEALKTVSK